MGRKTKTSVAEDLIDLVALLPWWLGVILAVVSHVGLHALAVRPIEVHGAVGSGLPLQALWRGAALAGQYIVPILCLAGAVVSAWRRHSRKRLLEQATGSQAVRVIDGMSWQQFEQLVGESLRRRGFSVRETGQGGADGGVDLVATRNGETYLVQAKHWRAQRVGVEVIRELYGVMAAKGAAGGFLVTSGRFTDEAKAFAKGRNVELVNGARLREWIEDERVERREPSMDQRAPALAPACPQCGRAMVKRTAKRGANAGRDFWGCSGYPGCKGTLPID